MEWPDERVGGGMNKDRRKKLETLKEQIGEIRGALEALRDEEQDYRDNMPENMADGERGNKADEVISAMEEAISSLESAEESIEEAVA